LNEIEETMLKKIICDALWELYHNDSYLIQHDLISEDNLNEVILAEVKEYVSERAIVFRFGIYLQKLMWDNEYLKDYHLDCEYNRNKNIIKKSDFERIIPDLIIHKRGSMEENLLVIEFKSWWNQDNYWDKEKIKNLTNPEGDYKYKFGVSIIINKEFSPKLEWISAERGSYEFLMRILQ
jgi:hypothetical protein